MKKNINLIYIYEVGESLFADVRFSNGEVNVIDWNDSRKREYLMSIIDRNTRFYDKRLLQ